MNTSVIVAIIGAIVSVIVAFIANRYTSQTARDAQRSTRELDQRKLDVESWKEQYQGWKDDALKLRTLREEDIKGFEVKATDFQEQINELRGQMDWMKEDRLRDQAYLFSVNAWCRSVVALLRDAGIPYPPPPTGLDSTVPTPLPEPTYRPDS